MRALEAAEAARRKEAAKAADRLKHKGTLDKQRAERAKVILCLLASPSTLALGYCISTAAVRVPANTNIWLQVCFDSKCLGCSGT